MKIKQGVIIEKLGDSYVAYDNDTQTLHEFNKQGQMMLAMIEKGNPKEKVIEKMMLEYEVSGTEMGADYDVFVDELKRKDLIVE